MLPGIPVMPTFQTSPHVLVYRGMRDNASNTRENLDLPEFGLEFCQLLVFETSIIERYPLQITSCIIEIPITIQEI